MVTLSEDSLNSLKTRKELLGNLAEIYEVAIDKYSRITLKNSERCSWGRLLVKIVGEMNNVLKDAEIEDVKLRLDRLEELVNSRYGN